MGKILVVDDESSIVMVIKALLTRAGHMVSTADNGNAALQLLSSETFDLLITDVRLPGIDGITLVQKAKELHPEMEVIVMTAYSDVDSALNAMKNGAGDYLVKPFNFNELIANIDRSLAGTQIVGIGSGGVQRKNTPKIHYGLLVGESKPMMDVYMNIESAASSELPFLLYGELGVGKELTARAVHNASLRSSAPCVSVDCVTLQQEKQLKSELFGSTLENGIFRNGLFQTAEGGTLILQNADLLPDSIQKDIAKAMESNRVLPSGAATEGMNCNIRLMATTCNNGVDTFEHSFAALFARSAQLRIPPLRERESDIPLFILKILNDYEIEQRIRVEISSEVVDLLKSYSWNNGNIDALSNYIQMLAADSKTACIELSDVKAHDWTKVCGNAMNTSSYSVYNGTTQYSVSSFPVTQMPEQCPLKQQLRRIEIQYIRRVIASCDGNKELAAERLGISLATLYRKLDEKDNMEDRKG